MIFKNSWAGKKEELLFTKKKVGTVLGKRRYGVEWEKARGAQETTWVEETAL